ncbi:hypothetical protein [Mesorhizobium sp.]|uniref:hypothetical protein n=1 Tax=Mesorhizobium sp. TaxID=1871066 RepID=UPI000FEA7548|nr:hypothetical protein [Mesorhizobium sp.]RWE99983.1 MAG: hypothetical protein EOS43_13815 [Mesorhizobium sp.]
MFDWSNTGSWPFDAPDHIFLGNAIIAFGKGLFGEQWTGRELRANNFVSGPLPDTADEAKYSQQSRASRLLLLHRPDLVPGGLESIEGDTNRPPRIIFTDEQWRAAVDVAAELSKDSAGEVSRAQGARLAVREHAAFGRLPTFAQSDDGEFHQIKRDRWNTPRFERWLTGCKISPADAYGGFTADVRLSLWIFVGKDELSTLASAPGARLPDSDEKTERVLKRGPASIDNLKLPLQEPQGKRKRRSQQQDLVKPYLRELYPDGIPDYSIMTDAELVQAVGKAMEARSKAVPSRETILRAAGRMSLANKAS